MVIRQYVREHVASFPFGRVRIDWLKPVLPLYSRALDDASLMDGGRRAFDPRGDRRGPDPHQDGRLPAPDQVDIETLLTANRDAIDLALIREEWSPVRRTGAGETAWLEAVIDRRVVRRE